MVMVFVSGIALALLAASASVVALPTLEAPQSISALSAAQIDVYKPYAFYADAAYSPPAETLTWTCGNCTAANPAFKPIASGGDGSNIQFWYVGYDPTLKSIIVGFEGTKAAHIIPLLTDADAFLDSLDSTLFPGVEPSIKTHNGFGNAQQSSALDVLAAVTQGLSTYKTTTVTTLGHSMGGAIAVISSAHLSLHLPTGTTLKTISFALPRVGNAAFANWANAKSNMVRINNKNDFVPIMPGRSLGFAHTEGEIHITDDNSWVSCPGQDNTDSQCTIGYVPNIFVGDVDDHDGPYDGVIIKSQSDS